jgi:hypothetical protein
VWEAFTDGWLLLVRHPDGYRIVGIAEDYDAARAWLTEPEVPEPDAGAP